MCIRDRCYYCVLQRNLVLVGYPNFHSRKTEFKIPVEYAILETERQSNMDENPNFMIRLRNKMKSWTFYSSNEENYVEWVTSLKRYCFLRGWWETYEIVEGLDHHNLKATVQLVRRRDNGEPFIAKIYEKSKVLNKSSMLNQVKNEIIVMRMLEHERLTRLTEVYKEEDQIVLIIEYMPGGTLCQRIMERRAYDETSGAMLFRFLIEGLEEMHAKEILHRDLKLENVFMLSDNQEIFIKLGDFDLALSFAEVDTNRLCGTPGYIAPEVYEAGRYSVKSDVFSAGVILFTILTGKFPFRPKEAKDKFFQRKATPMSFEMAAFKKLSEDARRLIQDMLAPAPDLRPTCSEILASTWIVRNTQRYFETRVGADIENCNLAEEDEEEDYNRSKQRNLETKNKYENTKSLFTKVKGRTPLASIEESKNQSINRSHEVCGVSTNFVGEGGSITKPMVHRAGERNTKRLRDFSLFEDEDTTKETKTYSGKFID
eukprot:TRINITY_DN9326_c0_g1_i3.p1 TRINITY_DN9326_c0_g1~~TRINITY_DN9326_c0_g1_i3.p1  ORF type:complete len:505 (+),score=85.10 TRINITY_DN9326_c0_g1_i3:60-1517(+)